MSKITPEQVVEAYQATNIAPIKNEYCFMFEETTKCGCALTALVSAKGSDGWDEIVKVEKESYRSMTQYLADKLGLDPRYVNNFIYGFDGASVNIKTEGYSDGQAARELVGEKIGFKWN